MSNESILITEDEHYDALDELYNRIAEEQNRYMEAVNRLSIAIEVLRNNGLLQRYREEVSSKLN